MPRVSTPVRALFVTQGALGTEILGLAAATVNTEAGLGSDPRVDARFVGLGPRGRLGRLALRHLPLLTAQQLDLFELRFHLTESARGLRALRRELRARPADVVHLTTHTLGLLTGPVRRSTPIILSVDATILDWGGMGRAAPPKPWRRALITPDLALERRAFARADLVATWSDWARDAVLRAAPDANARVLHPGLDLGRFNPATTPRRPGPARLLFVGGRLEGKGGLDLLRAVRPLLDAGRAELDMVTPEAVPATPGVRVHRLQGGDQELVELYRQADLFCLPSWGDASPFVVLEALACGTPVVGSTVGAIPEMLDGGRAGVVVAPHDVAGLREAIETLIDDPARRRTLAAQGLEMVGERYDARKQTEVLIRTLEEIATARRRRPTTS